jgi:NitT/TauT family transport system permease protein
MLLNVGNPLSLKICFKKSGKILKEIMNNKHQKWKILFIQTLIILLFALIWEGLGRSSKNIFFLIGTPLAVAGEFWQLLIAGNFIGNFFITGAEAVVGLLIGTLIGTVLGLSLWFSESAAFIAKPFVTALGALPVFALAPLMIVWFGVGFGMKVAIAVFSTVFVAFNQAYKGANSVALEYIDTLKGMNASRSQIFQKVIIPGSLDWVLSSIRLNVGFGLLGAFIGEYISSNEGLGYLILRASNLYNIPRAFAAAIGIIALALILDNIAQFIERRRYTIVQWISVPPQLWHR